MKTVNLNSVTLKKNGTPVELMGVTDKENNFELVSKVTLEEEVMSYVWTSTTKYKACKVDIKLPSAYKNSLFIAFGKNSQVRGVGGNVDGDAVSGICRPLYGHWDFFGYQGYASSGSQSLGPISVNDSIAIDPTGFDSVGYMRFYSFNKAFPVGTVIKIYCAKE